MTTKMARRICSVVVIGALTLMILYFIWPGWVWGASYPKVIQFTNPRVYQLAPNGNALWPTGCEDGAKLVGEDDHNKKGF
jgi:hypothetical protein